MKRTPVIAAAMICFAVMATAFFSCKKDNNDSQGTARVNFHLTDGPGPYDAVYVDIQQVEVHSDISGWVTLTPVRPGIYNLMDFRNGMDTLLCAADIPAGKVSQMRLILGANNSVIVNGTAFSLGTPSAQESGLKLNIDDNFSAGGAYDVWVDFDAGRSIVQTGNGQYKLKPVIRAYSAATNGKIKGIILPATSGSVVYAINGTDTSSAIPDLAGNFTICGLNNGTYTLWVNAGITSGLQDTLLANLSVTYGNTTNVGTIILVP